MNKMAKKMNLVVVVTLMTCLSYMVEAARNYEACSSTSECTGKGQACKILYTTCTKGFCDCVGYEVWDEMEGKCQPIQPIQPIIGSACTTTPEWPKDSICVDGKVKCSPNTTFSLHDGACNPGTKGLGEECSTVSDCYDIYAICTAAVGTKSTCTCNTNYKNVYGECRKARLGESCESDADCFYNSCGSDKKCGCISPQTIVDGRCIHVGTQLLNETCNSTAPCEKGLDCTICYGETASRCLKQPTSGFYCYKCTHIKSNIPIPGLPMTEDQACHDGDTTKMKSVECATGAACLTNTADITGSVAGKDYTIQTTVRQCLGVDASSNGCKALNDSTVMRRILTDVDTFRGTKCVCITDNCIPAPTTLSSTAFKCYACTHVKSNIPVPGLSMTQDQACRDGDTTKMNNVECTTGAACMKSTAEISGSASGKDFTVEFTTRGCLGVAASSTECATTDDPSNVAALRGMTGVKKTTGTKYTCTTDNCNGQSMQSPGILTFVISLVMAIFVSV